MTALDAAVAAGFTGADPTQVPKDLIKIIEAAMLNQPRSLQKRIGPSELGIECDRCLAHKLAGTPEKRDAAWLPFIGTAVHAALEDIILRHEFVRADLGMPGRFLPENRVTVGPVGEVEITGSTDVFDIPSGTVVDWKIVGATTLKKVKGHGASLVYSRQAHLYGKGWQDSGYQVRSVLIFFLPRNAVSLSAALPWQIPYDRAVAIEALARADAIAMQITATDLQAVLDSMPPHTGEGFSCARMPDFTRIIPTSDTPFGALT